MISVQEIFPLRVDQSDARPEAEENAAAQKFAEARAALDACRYFAEEQKPVDSSDEFPVDAWTRRLATVQPDAFAHPAASRRVAYDSPAMVHSDGSMAEYARYRLSSEARARRGESDAVRSDFLVGEVSRD